MIKNAILALIVIILAASPGYTAEPIVSVLPAAVEKAVLAEDWAGVAKLIGDVKPDAPAPLRLILGHACLALNRNNDSLCLFLGATGPDDLAAWQTYARDFKKRNPQSPIADYLVGDSLARLEKYDDAIATFDAGLKVKLGHPLLLNAKGVCLAKAGKVRESRAAFDAAIGSSEGGLADSYSNLGCYWIQRSEGAEAAACAFTNAIILSTSHSLAAHGLMCIRLIQGRQEEAAHMDYVAKSCSCLPTEVNENGLAYARAVIAREGVDVPQDALGTFIQRSVSSSSPSLSSYVEKRIGEQQQFEQSQWVPQPLKDWGRYNMNNDIARESLQYEARYGAGSAKAEVSKLPASSQSAVGDAMYQAKRSTDRWATLSDVVGGPLSKTAGAALTAVGAAASALTKTPLPAIRGATAGAAVSELGSAAFKANGGRLRTEGTFYDTLRTGLPQHYSPSAIPEGGLRSPTTPEGYKGTITIPGTRTPVKNDGGARLSFKNVNWDDGNWPFKPIYGLAYGVGLARKPESAAPATADVSKRDGNEK